MTTKRRTPTTTNVARLIDLLPDLSLGSIRQRGGRKHAKERQKALIEMIRSTFDESAKEHNRRPGSVSFGCYELRHRLQAADSRRIHALIAPFFDYPAERKRFYRGSTKPYKLKPQVVETLKRWAAESGNAKLTSITKQEALDAADVALEQGNLKARAGLLHIADQIEDSLPNTYVGQQSNGRLVPDSGPHLVTMPREQRKLLLQQLEEDCWDYDLNSCHPRIALDLCQHYGLPHWRLLFYIDHRTEIAANWQRLVGHKNSDDFKEIVLSFLNGGTLSPAPKATCGHLLGFEGAKKFVAFKMVVDLHREIQDAMKVIVKKLGNMPNAVGIEPSADFTFSQRCSHILTGFEQYALRVVCAQLPEGSLVSTVYDGWITRTALSSEMLRGIEEQVTVESRRDLGIRLHLKISGKPVKDAAYYFTPDE